MGVKIELDTWFDIYLKMSDVSYSVTQKLLKTNKTNIEKEKFNNLKPSAYTSNCGE